MFFFFVFFFFFFFLGGGGGWGGLAGWVRGTVGGGVGDKIKKTFFGDGVGVCGAGATLTIFLKIKSKSKTKKKKQKKPRNVTVCNKCPRRSLITTLIPGCDLEHSQGTSLAQDVTCHFVLLFCVTLTLGKEP